MYNTKVDKLEGHKVIALTSSRIISRALCYDRKSFFSKTQKESDILSPLLFFKKHTIKLKSHHLPALSIRTIRKTTLNSCKFFVCKPSCTTQVLNKQFCICCLSWKISPSWKTNFHKYETLVLTSDNRQHTVRTYVTNSFLLLYSGYISYFFFRQHFCKMYFESNIKPQNT